MAVTAQKETLGFQTEVKQLLHLVIHSLYSNKEIFLRELISNASDAADKLRFEALSDNALFENDPDLKVKVEFDKEKKQIIITDNGIGMSRQEVMDNLGTIAKSGTKVFMDALSGDKAKDAQLIGQFGVGFYSAYIVADKVTVESRRAGTQASQGVRWESAGEGEYSLENIDKVERGTRIILHLKDGEEEFLEPWRLRTVITKYSDHIPLPVLMAKESTNDFDDVDAKDMDEEEVDATCETKEDKAKESKTEESAKAESKTETKAKTKKAAKTATAKKTRAAKISAPEFETVNQATALWTVPKSKIKAEEYKELYKHVSHAFDEPLAWSHNKVEGKLEYTSLLYLPSTAPFDLWNRDKPHGLKLYVQRVFIMDNAEVFLPFYLRFIKGVVDSSDLPLNISREILQNNKVVDTIKAAVVKRSLAMIGKIAEDEDKEKYAKFWRAFGQALKEGPAEDFANKAQIGRLLRFSSTFDDKTEQAVSLTDYIGRMKEGQDKIYYINAENFNAAKNSPHLEIFRKKGIEVLLLTDRIDEWLVTHLTEFDDRKLQSVAKGNLDLGDVADEQEKEAQKKTEVDFADFAKQVKDVLGEKVSDVRITHRLTESPACIVVGENELGGHMQQILKAAGQAVPDSKPNLELNPHHPIVTSLRDEADTDRFRDISHLLLEQSILAEGGQLEDPAQFIRRMNKLLLELSA